VGWHPARHRRCVQLRPGHHPSLLQRRRSAP
jgi:hypothetical protein